MTANIPTLVRWEWFKLQRRWMPWILLAILLLFSQIAIWGGFLYYNSLQSSGGQVVLPDETGGGQVRMVSCNQLAADPSSVVPAGTAPEVISGLLTQCQQQAAGHQTEMQEQYDSFTLPGGLTSAFGVAHAIALILLTVLTASAIGSDYGLGTLRPTLASGMGRLPYLASKFLMLIGAAAGALLIVGALTLISGLIVTAIAEAPPGGAVAATTWSDAGTALAKTWLSFIPYIVLTAAVTLWTRSAAAGMGIGLGYYFAETLLVTLLSAFFDWFTTVADYLLISNITQFAGGGIDFSGGAGSEGGLVQASILLAVYTVALGWIGIWLFRRRDVTGATGG